MAFPQNIWILWLLILVSLVMITIKLESKPGEKLYTTNWHTVLACLYTADVILLVYMFMRIHAKRKRTMRATLLKRPTTVVYLSKATAITEYTLNIKKKL